MASPCTPVICGKLCGETKTRMQQGQVVYALNVLADVGEATTGCGVVGRTVQIEVDDLFLQPQQRLGRSAHNPQRHRGFGLRAQPRAGHLCLARKRVVEAGQ
ncbi:MAG: hypothetical protein HC853_15760 [Anaerolineae bacterium]|nr:hypothetical protein [Anaerolineae bacterium]